MINNDDDDEEFNDMRLHGNSKNYERVVITAIIQVNTGRLHRASVT